MAWEVPGESMIRFKDPSFVSKVYPGLLTVTLLRTEHLPKVGDIEVRYNAVSLVAKVIW